MLDYTVNEVSCLEGISTKGQELWDVVKLINGTKDIKEIEHEL